MQYTNPFITDIAEEILDTCAAIFNNGFSYEDLEDALDDESIRRIFRVAAGSGVLGHYGNYAIEVAYVRDSGRVEALRHDSRYSDLFVERQIAPNVVRIERWRAAA